MPLLKNRKLLLPLLFALVLVLDIWSKQMVVTHMRLFETVAVIPGFFNITYILNSGAAFGLFNDQPEYFRKFFFLGAALVACAFVLIMLVKEFSYKLRSFCYVLILSGAIGNLIDRIKMDKVVDFLDFYIHIWHWYAFNIADAAITTGISLMFLDIFLSGKKRK